MRHRYAHVLNTVFNRPWAIERPMLDLMARIVLERVRGDKPTDAEIEARVEAAAVTNGERLGRQDVGGVAVIPVYGLIAPKMNLMLAFSGGTSLEELTGALDEAMADADVKAIVLDIDSPGGSVNGLGEFATYLRGLRDKGEKRIVASVNYWGASAAYYIAAQTHEIFVSPSGQVGAIGTIAQHVEYSRMDDAAGITTTVITSANAPFKAEGNDVEPLSDDARGEIQRVVDHFGREFVNDVAKGRGVTASKVAEDFGQGRMLLANEAVSAGMADGVATLGQVIQRQVRPARARGGALRAEDEAPLITATEGSPEVTDIDPPAHEGDADPAETAPPPIPAGVVTRTPAERMAAAASLTTRSH